MSLRFYKSIIVLIVLSTPLASTRTVAAQEAAAATKPALMEKHVIGLEAMKQRRIVRTPVPYSKTIRFVDGGRQYGTAV